MSKRKSSVGNTAKSSYNERVKMENFLASTALVDENDLPHCGADNCWCDGSCFPEGMSTRTEMMTKKTSALEVQVAGGHYKKWKIQPVEFCHANNIPFPEGNVIKYTVRHKDKNGIEDLRKAKHFLELIAYLEYGEEI